MIFAVELISAIIFLLWGLFVGGANAAEGIRAVFRGEKMSMTPVIGGLSLSIGLWLLPYDFGWGWILLPFAVEPGCLLLVMLAVWARLRGEYLY